MKLLKLCIANRRSVCCGFILSPCPPAPCPPTNIEAFRDCDANHALIVWQNHQPTGLYTATIEDQNGALLNCTSNTVNNCKIKSLPCGRRYNITVTYYDGNCPSTSPSINMDSGNWMKGRPYRQRAAVHSELTFLSFSAVWSRECDRQCGLW